MTSEATSFSKQDSLIQICIFDIYPWLSGQTFLTFRNLIPRFLMFFGLWLFNEFNPQLPGHPRGWKWKNSRKAIKCFWSVTWPRPPCWRNARGQTVRWRNNWARNFTVQASTIPNHLFTPSFVNVTFWSHAYAWRVFEFQFFR